MHAEADLISALVCGEEGGEECWFLFFFLAVELEFKPRQFSLPSVAVVKYSAFSHSGSVRPDGQITERSFLEFRLFHVDPVRVLFYFFYVDIT